MKKLFLVMLIAGFGYQAYADECYLYRLNFEEFVLKTKKLDRNNVEWKLSATRRNDDRTEYTIVARFEEGDRSRIDTPHFEDAAGILSRRAIQEVNCEMFDLRRTDILE